MTWRDVPGRPTFEFQVTKNEWGGSLVMVRTKAKDPCFKAGRHVRGEMSPMELADAVDGCVARIEAAVLKSQTANNC